jgi:hypothetical protein
MKDYPFAKANPQKAKYYLNLALNHNIYLAALSLSFLQSPLNAIDTLEKTIKKAPLNIKNLLAIREVEIVLNDLYYNKSLIKHTIKTTYPIYKQTKDNVLAFGLAHLFFILKDLNTANYLLNKACTSNNQQLKNLCLIDPFIKQQKEKK